MLAPLDTNLDLSEGFLPKDLVRVSDSILSFVEGQKKIVSDIIHLRDPRLVVPVGPCSIHDYDEAIQYAEILSIMKRDFPNLYPLMRVYLEKPRTDIGRKGFVNDPYLDGSCDIEHGIKESAKLLEKINQMGIGVATEFLDPIIAEFLKPYISWGAIGARTTESQTHREMTAGLGVPVGLKNGTDGSVDIAVNAIKSSLFPHTHLGIGSNGKIIIKREPGNPDTHIILRGGSSGTNYDEESIKKALTKLKKADINTGIMVDFSHGNRENGYFKDQIKVSREVAKQIASGNKQIMGVMIESNLEEGKQSFKYLENNKSELKPGLSITDPGVGLYDTAEIFKMLDLAVARRNKILGKN